MPAKADSSNRIFNIMVIIFVIVRIFMFFYHFNYPVFDQHSFRQTHNLMIIRNFFRDGINLFLPRADNFGEVGYALLEAPFYQGIVAGLAMLFNGQIEAIGRIMSIFSTLITAMFLYMISVKYLNKRTSILASLIFLFAPSIIYYSRTIMIEPFIVMLTMISLYFYLQWIEKGGLGLWSLAVIFGCLAVLQKPMYAFAVYIPIIYHQYKNHGSRGLFYFDFVLSLAVPAASAFGWLCHGIIMGNIFPNSLMLSSGKLMYEWYFGSISQRLNLMVYAHLVMRSAVYILGVLGAIPLIFTFIKWKQIPGVFCLWLAGAVLYVLIFINLNYVHDYYQYPLIPILAIFQAIGLEQIIQARWKFSINKDAVLVSMLTVMFIVNAGISLDRFKPKDGSFYDMAKIVSQSVPERSNVAFITDYMGPQPLYFTDTKGYFTKLTDIDINDLKWQILKMRIQYIVIIGELNGPVRSEVKKYELLDQRPITVKNEKGKIAVQGKIYIYKL